MQVLSLTQDQINALGDNERTGIMQLVGFFLSVRTGTPLAEPIHGYTVYGNLALPLHIYVVIGHLAVLFFF